MALSEAVESCDPYTRGHSARVAGMAAEVGRRLGCDDAQIALLRLGGALHDVGKLGVRDEILRKPGPLTRRELREVRAHPEIGARMIAHDPELCPALEIVLYHHERWDGEGYPSGRSGTEVPPEARILAVMDSYDAMTSDRPYRAALPPELAVEEIGRCAGTQFDPDFAAVFVAAWESGAFGVTAALRAAV
jgi:HD-GYP domain-containing protein (c-di-GMP phosphodiesterase class II)